MSIDVVAARPRPRKLTAADGQSTDRRSQIAASASDLFAEYGFEATSVRQIADAVNILAGSLYHHFATKEEMLHEVLRPRIGQLARDNRMIADLPGDAEQQLVASVIMRFRQYVESWQFHTILLQEGRFFRRNADFAYVVEGKLQAFSVQQAMLRKGMEAGLFRTDMDTYMMIGTISRILSGAAAWYRSGDIFSSDRPIRYTLDGMIDFHIDAVLRMVRAPARLAEPIPRTLCEALLKGAEGQ